MNVPEALCPEEAAVGNCAGREKDGRRQAGDPRGEPHLALACPPFQAARGAEAGVVAQEAVAGEAPEAGAGEALGAEEGAEPPEAGAAGWAWACSIAWSQPRSWSLSRWRGEAPPLPRTGPG